MQYRHFGGNAFAQRCGDDGVGAGVVFAGATREVVQEQHRIGLADTLPSAGNADLFDCIVAMAQARRVHNVQRHAFNLDGFEDLVPGSAGDGRDDGTLGAGQRVEQRRFAGIGLASDHDPDALAQQCSLAGARQHIRQGLPNAQQLPAGVGLLQEVDFLFREIQRGLDQHAQVDQGVAQDVDFA